jgi:hypothetical protein
MRLIDRLRDIRRSAEYKEAKQTIGQDVQNYLDIVCASDLPVIDVSNVADYAAGDASRIESLRDDVLTCAPPPFSLCWMEFRAIKGRIAEIGHWGGLVAAYDMHNLPPEVPSWMSELLAARKDCGWLVTVSFSVLAPNGTLNCGNLKAVIVLDKDGNALTRIRPSFEGGFKDSSEAEQIALDVGISAQTLIESMAWLAMNIFNIASAFMSCKNVQLIENQPPRYERRQREREKKPPLTKYYTLEIEPMKKILRTEGKSEEVGLKKALHICRGHFAHYTPDKPLFGKVSGRFWIPAHVRGSKEVGEIKKDYKINISKGN